MLKRSSLARPRSVGSGAWVEGWTLAVSFLARVEIWASRPGSISGSAEASSTRESEADASSGIEELVPFLDDEVVFVRPLMPIGDVAGARLQRAAIAQIAFLDAAF